MEMFKKFTENLHRPPAMKIFKTLSVAACVLLGTSAYAQLDIPVSSVSLEYPGIGAVTIRPGATVENVLPTPFLLSGLESRSRAWFCMDPLQRIYYNASGLPAGSQIHYASFLPSDFDLWAPGAPGLTSSRVQDLADLFYAWWPSFNNPLVGAGLQIAIWEIANEFNGNPYDLSTGQFIAYNNAAYVNEAQLMLNSLSLGSVHGHGNVAGLSFLIDGTTPINNQVAFVQDLVGYNPIPEPSSYGIAGAMGLGLIVAWRRRRSRRLAASV